MFKRNRPKGRLIQITESGSGKKKSVRLRKWIPKKCSNPKRICLSCQKNSIHKNSKLYDLKICEDCHAV